MKLGLNTAFLSGGWGDGAEKLMLKVNSASTGGGLEARAKLGKNVKEFFFYWRSGSRIGAIIPYPVFKTSFRLVSKS